MMQLSDKKDMSVEMMCELKARSGRKSNGFSLIELMIVLVISLVVAAFAIPSMSGAITNMRLRSAMSSIAGILQETRIMAVKRNTFGVARNTTYVGSNMFYDDINFDNAYTPAAGTTAAEPTVAVPVSVTFQTTPPTTFPVATLIGATPLTSPTVFNVGFNARGLPCTPTGGSPVTGTPASCFTDGTVGYLVYFKIAGSFGDNWSAITITPAGRIRTWILNGTHWN